VTESFVNDCEAAATVIVAQASAKTANAPPKNNL
jgi:hypothetical protein